MRTKATAWYHRENDEIWHGIKVFSGGRWFNLAEDGKAVLFRSEAEMEKKRAELRRQPEFVVAPRPKQEERKDD